ncbi:putative response regulatory protein [Anoxybacillus ayderensis]|uniref:Putative response regulatory protein n=1 Tax=Anoxybacillus ayderensis TaxID=265546 RepID=A0A0D0HQP9_9BACL|nr:response regulator [Anoxybacillus ayderensis]KIP21637.1 putative response regulatory protein [Anoxybacillus ayderensis]
MRTWKVLIADDEAIIREGIREAIDWNEFQMEVVAEAEDGEEAMELALRHQIDILFVDLTMPIMDGISLMKQIRKNLSKCRIVVVTGHDEFAYAQEAIRLQVDDYILKPTNPSHLREVAKKIQQQLTKELQQSEYVTLLSKQVQKNFQLIRQQFCLEWIHGRLKEIEIFAQLQFFKLPSTCPVQLAVIYWQEFFSTKLLMSEKEKQLFFFAIENIASELLEGKRKVVFRDTVGFIVVCLWDWADEELFRTIEKTIKQYLNIQANIYAAEVEGELTKVADAYEICKKRAYSATNISPIVRRAKQYVQEHFSDQTLTLESVAQSLNVSPVYLSRIMKQELGISFVNFLTEVRIKKAIQLLVSTQLTIHEISERVGYDTQHYFSTAFKKVVGVSPNQYRKGAFLFKEVREVLL